MTTLATKTKPTRATRATRADLLKLNERIEWTNRLIDSLDKTREMSLSLRNHLILIRAGVIERADQLDQLGDIDELEQELEKLTADKTVDAVLADLALGSTPYEQDTMNFIGHPDSGTSELPEPFDSDLGLVDRRE